MSFGNPIPFLELTDVNTLIPVTQIIPNPNYVQATDTHPFNPHHGSDPGDLAVIILPALVTQGITPATLPTLGQLDELAAKNALHGAVFTAVGYGSQDGFGNRSNPLPRMFAFSTFRALTPGFLQLSINPALNNGGACYGDWRSSFSFGRWKTDSHGDKQCWRRSRLPCNKRKLPPRYGHRSGLSTELCHFILRLFWYKKGWPHTGRRVFCVGSAARA
jgi:hypothetical protein